MSYLVKNIHMDGAGHTLLQLQNRKTQECVAACDTEIEARRTAGKMEYILKAITLEDHRVWLWQTDDLSAAYRRKDQLDALLLSPAKWIDTS
ncbi:MULTISPECIES: hypothetical protein [Caproicibacterium]|uniref:Uncharacterized protein n=1 Tax=Caproicibacterium argilliputei TaxID=3030016 RepID=A0AA97DAD3_9FIRM|nr:hypothetical protein [Caproicibacterium argilliputei]WOC32377.1 hypothetical protein PXC00_00485 [Caproicibacterium argilliputei]